MADRTPPSGSSNPVAGTVLEPLLARFHIDFIPADPQPSWAGWPWPRWSPSSARWPPTPPWWPRARPCTRAPSSSLTTRFPDYAKLTVIGVVVACVGLAGGDPGVVPAPLGLRAGARWPSTAVLLAARRVHLAAGRVGARASLVLVVMHLAIAVVTYNTVVRIAPADGGRSAPVGVGAGA